MVRGEQKHIQIKKKSRETDREMTTGLFLHRAFSCGISATDLYELSIGMVNDIFIESANDQYEYSYIATQEDIDRL